ncbi:MAG: hypothetical protein R2789_07445 [Microthrixaceae bacterium]
MAWPAYGVLVITGLWNILAVPLGAIPHPEIEIKILVVALSGIGAASTRTPGATRSSWRSVGR